ncbi:MAG: methanethiol S-methyltransferase [Planctomycetota bacterium]|jgi:protein-S-isoprenylcysteine O-methyltransferase Ste14
MQRIAYFAYGLFSHLLFLGVFLWMAAFVGNLFLPQTIDAAGAGFTWTAVGIDTVLIALFGLQHSVMARPGFKRWWTRIVPAQIERSTYVLISCIVLVAMLLLWQPIGPLVWDVTHPVGRALLWGLFAAGWLMVPVVSLLINHFDLFGTRQVWLALKGKAYTQLPFRVPGIYRFVRHPLYVGWTLAFWVTPTMSVGHLLFAVGMTAYMLLAIPIEERDLVELHGEKYTRYRETVPALVPRFARPAAIDDTGRAPEGA